VRVAKPILSNGVLDWAAWLEKAGSFDVMGIQSRGGFVGMVGSEDPAAFRRRFVG